MFIKKKPQIQVIKLGGKTVIIEPGKPTRMINPYEHSSRQRTPPLKSDDIKWTPSHYGGNNSGTKQTIPIGPINKTEPKFGNYSNYNIGHQPWSTYRPTVDQEKNHWLARVSYERYVQKMEQLTAIADRDAYQYTKGFGPLGSLFDGVNWASDKIAQQMTIIQHGIHDEMEWEAWYRRNNTKEPPPNQWHWSNHRGAFKEDLGRSEL